MTKHGRKRQKISKDETVHPLGSNVTSLLADDARKDDEERRLESMLFGVPYAPSSSHTKRNGDQTGFVISDEEDEDADAAAAGTSIRELEHMLDSDVCTLRIRIAVSDAIETFFCLSLSSCFSLMTARHPPARMLLLPIPRHHTFHPIGVIVKTNTTTVEKKWAQRIILHTQAKAKFALLFLSRARPLPQAMLHAARAKHLRGQTLTTPICRYP